MYSGIYINEVNYVYFIVLCDVYKHRSSVRSFKYAT
jgi:hypothetical protein